MTDRVSLTVVTAGLSEESTDTRLGEAIAKAASGRRCSPLAVYGPFGNCVPPTPATSKSCSSPPFTATTPLGRPT